MPRRGVHANRRRDGCGLGVGRGVPAEPNPARCTGDGSPYLRISIDEIGMARSAFRTLWLALPAGSGRLSGT